MSVYLFWKHSYNYFVHRPIITTINKNKCFFNILYLIWSIRFRNTKQSRRNVSLVWIFSNCIRISLTRSDLQPHNTAQPVSKELKITVFLKKNIFFFLLYLMVVFIFVPLTKYVYNKRIYYMYNCFICTLICSLLNIICIKL